MAEDGGSEQRKAAAHHEAGHVVAALALGAEFSWVELNPDGSGMMRRDAVQAGGALSDQWIGPDAEIIIIMAGPLAEGRHEWGEEGAEEGLFWESADHDNEAIERGFAVRDDTPDERERRRYRLIYTTLVLLGRHWHRVKRIAQALDARPHLSYQHAASLFEGCDLSLTEVQALAAWRRRYGPA